MIYLRQEKFEFAEHHFRMAFQINPRSSVIMSYLGTALHTLKVCLLNSLVYYVMASGKIVLLLKFQTCVPNMTEKQGGFVDVGEGYFSR